MDHPMLKTPIFALPALVAEPHTEEFTKRRIAFKKRLVRVGPYELDAYIFQGVNVQDVSLIFIEVLMIIGAESCTNVADARWGNRTVPYVLTKTGKVSIIPLSEKEEDRDKVEGYPYPEIRILLEKFSRLAGGLDINLFAENRNTARPPLPDVPNLINIFPWSYTPGYSASKYIRHAFGHQIDTKAGGGVLTFSGNPGRGEFVGDEENDLVQMVGNNWYFLFCVVEFSNSITTSRILDSALAVTLSRYQDLRAGASPSNKGVRLNRKKFVNVTTKWMNTLSENIEEEVKKQEAEIERLRVDMAKMERNLFDMQCLSRTVRENAQKGDNSLRTLYYQWSRIRSNPHISELWLAGDMINVTTVGVNVNHDGKIHPLGRYAIGAHKNGDFYIWSIDRLHPEGVPHPHINKEGTPCFGNAGSAIKNAFKEHRYADGIGYIIRWLFDGYQDNLALHKITEWPVKTLAEGGASCQV